MNFSPFPILETNRLLLRSLKESDCNVIFYLRSNAKVNQFIKRPKPENIDDALAFINKIKKNVSNNECIYWCITLKDNPNLIGTISLWNFSEDRKTAEVGYDLHPDFHKKGIMKEALQTVLNFGFNSLNFETIEAFTQKNNTNSIKLLTNNNFIHIKNRKDKGNLYNHIFTLQKRNFNLSQHL